ncbi:MAG: hypothetical protein JXR37_00780 [Kiritimatiellae bacterium]|nr:hypothetical protein [Kiritimatiellia bacterium]
MSRIANVPTPVKMVIGGSVIGAIGYFAYWMFGTKGLLLLFVGLLLVGLLVALYAYLVKAAKKRKARQFGQEMMGQGAATPQGITQAEQLAKLDDLRRKFGEGVQKFRAAGKDVYGLPWYMIVGEPGSGKTEAIRHSNIGFPPGLHDELQGVGGTINMNWWFTNHAVVLDLAGRLIFEDVEAGAGSEWQEFLRLLLKHRPNCPVNGLLLVIPADSLIKDSADEIQRKGAKIARQLDLIQRTLDIRFPVFVVVTKSDLINGFREFFDDITSPQLQHQIMGWSNPLSIDDAFNPEAVDQYLAGVQQDLGRRRLALLQSPTPSQDLSDRRVDEVDTLFDFPHSFARIAGPLKHYLQLIFVSGEWSAKPLFLRGIYFTSSMREGSALDAELAEALGVPMDSLPEGRAWERDRAYFLRDVFMKKAFPEQGLVTRATNVRQQHMRRRLMVMGAGFVSAAVLLLLTWLGGRRLDATIGKERDLWAYTAKVVETEKKRGGAVLPIVVREDPEQAAYRYNGTSRMNVEGRKMNLGRFHQDLFNLVKNRIRIPLIFRLSRPFDQSLRRQRNAAHRVFFEVSVVEPLVRAARDLMKAEPESKWGPQATAALGELVRIEAQLAGLDYLSGEDAGHVDLEAFFRYVLARPEDYEAYEGQDNYILKEALAWAYSGDGGRGEWPPPWLSKGGRLADNEALERGVRRLIAFCSAPPELAGLNEQLALVKALWPKLVAFEGKTEKRYLTAEERFVRVLTVNMDRLRAFIGFQQIEKDWREEYTVLGAAWAELKPLFTELETNYRKIPICREADIEAAYGQVVTNVLRQVEECFNTLPLPSGPGGWKAAVAAVAKAENERTLEDEIRVRMYAALNAVRERHLQTEVIDQLKEFGALYAETAERQRAYAERFELYQPLLLPDDLRINKMPWAQCHTRLGRMEVSYVHEDLEAFCKKIDSVFAGYEKLVGEPGKAKVDVIRKQAALGLSRVESRNFKRECEKILENWSRLRGEPLPDREAVLAAGGKDFKRDYLVLASELQADYVAQYWDDLIQNGLECLADDALKQTREILPALKRYARFPLDLPRVGVTELSPQELADAAEALGKVRPMDPVEGGKTLGEGADTAVPRVDRQIQRLRDLELGEWGRWIRSAKHMLAALPAGADRRLACTVWLLPPKEQQRLLDAFGKGDMRDDSALPVWTIVELFEGEGRRSTRFRTTQGTPTQIGRIRYPGDGFELKLYKYHSDTQPHRSQTYEGHWGALGLLHTLPCEQAKDSPTKYNVQVPLKDDSGRERILWLQLEFEQALPAIADWPSAGRLFSSNP